MVANMKGSAAREQVANGHAQERVDDGPVSAAGLHVSEALYWEKYYHAPDSAADFSYEWNNGVLEVKPMPDPLQYRLYAWFVALLHAYLEVHPVAQTMALEMGFRLAMTDAVTIRKPDLLVVRHDSPQPLDLYDRSYSGICDLCIESLSDSAASEVVRDTQVKKREYAAVGVREYFLLDAKGVHTSFNRLTGGGVYTEIEPDSAGVIGSEVLPGFRFRVADLYRRPSLLELADDEVYQDYVMLAYQQERARAEQEHARAERLAAKLRELGIDEEDL